MWIFNELRLNGELVSPCFLSRYLKNSIIQLEKSTDDTPVEQYIWRIIQFKSMGHWDTAVIKKVIND